MFMDDLDFLILNLIVIFMCILLILHMIYNDLIWNAGGLEQFFGLILICIGSIAYQTQELISLFCWIGGVFIILPTLQSNEN